MMISVNGVSLFYRHKGAGEPMILLHGNGESSAIYQTLLNTLSREYSVYALDSRDHGQSGRTPGLLSYADMAEDLAGFIAALGLKKPVILGFSDGGIVALMLAAAYPALPKKLIVCGASCHPREMKAHWLAFIRLGFRQTRDKKLHLMLTQPNITRDMLRRITAPTLVLAGSRDMIREKATVTLAANLPHSRLRILKNETHGSYVINSRKLLPAILPFIKSEA